MKNQTPMTTVDLDIQHASEFSPLPSDADLLTYANLVLDGEECSLTIRLVDKLEIQELNNEFRQKDKPTNVLSFPFIMPDLPGMDLNLLGDVIICLDIVKEEADAQGKPFDHHLAHMVIHGILHLLGYDHIKEEDALAMEEKEVSLLQKINIANPYGDDE